MSVLFDRNKNKAKIEINKALSTINNIVKPTSEIKAQLEACNKDIVIDRADKVHGKTALIQKQKLTNKTADNSSSVNTPKTPDLITTVLPTPIYIIPLTKKICICCLRF